MPLLLTHKIKQSTALLEKAGIDDAARDARILICHALKCERIDLVTDQTRLLSEDEQALVDAVIARRANHEPVSRIKNCREFWGLPFCLNAATLDPRSDSETLIETALEKCKKQPEKILDLGTGSGCLLLALLHEFTQAQGIGVDLSPHALEQAQGNALALGLSSRAQFVLSSWFDAVEGPFDLIISNPPYIPSNDIPTLQEEVKDFDPLAALDGGEDGLAPYRLIIPLLPLYLAKDGLVLFEVGIGQSDEVAHLLAQNGMTPTIHKDLGGIDRCVAGVF